MQVEVPLHTRIIQIFFFFHFNTLLSVKLLENFKARERSECYFNINIKGILKNRFSIILFTRVRELK